MARNVRDRQVARPYIRRNAHQAIRNISRQLNGNCAVNRALIIVVELTDLERRALDLSKVPGSRIRSRRSLRNATAFDNTHRAARDTFNLDRPRRHVQVERLERVGIKRFARKLLRPSGIVTAIQEIIVVKHIVKIRQISR